MQKTEEEYNRIISNQDAEIKKLKEELMHATKPSVFFSSLKSRVRSDVRNFFDREEKIKQMDAKMKEMKKELDTKSELLDMVSAQLKAASMVSSDQEEPLFEEEEVKEMEHDASADIDKDLLPQDAEEAIRRYFGENIDLNKISFRGRSDKKKNADKEYKDMEPAYSGDSEDAESMLPLTQDEPEGYPDIAAEEPGSKPESSGARGKEPGRGNRQKRPGSSQNKGLGYRIEKNAHPKRDQGASGG